MLDEKDLRAIAQLLTQQKVEIIEEMDQKMDVRFAQQKAEIMEEMDQRMDARFAQQKIEIIEEMDQKMDVRFAQQEFKILGEMDARFAQQKQEINVQFSQQRQEIMHEVNLLMESYFDPKFNALADGLDILKEKILGREELEEASDRLDVLEAVVKIHSREIEKLKKSQSA